MNAPTLTLPRKERELFAFHPALSLAGWDGRDQRNRRMATDAPQISYVREASSLAHESDTLRKSALTLVATGLVWNFLEAGVAFWAAAQSGSVALLAYGLDSVIEILAGGVLVWRLRTGLEESEAEAAEGRDRRLVALSFFLLAAYIAIHSLANLLGSFTEPEPSLVGIVLVVASAVVMSALYVGKMRIATRMQLWSLRAEALESLFCDLQDSAILVGLVLNSLLAWWWADTVVALLLIPFFIKEGLENLPGHDDCGHGHDEEHGQYEEHARRICFCRSCMFGLRNCRASCCQV